MGKVKITLAGITALIFITAIAAAFITNRASATRLEPQTSITVKIVEADGVRPHVWKFKDGRMTCYFTNGGIWCTP